MSIPGLYYRLRQSYGDQRLLHEHPAIYSSITKTTISFLQLTILNGWDAEIFPDLTYGGSATARAFSSHDELVLLAHRD